MAYLAMARKWRPRNFEEMVGQDHIARTIRNAIEGGRIHHAYLFTGTRGVGKTTSARILAKALNCEKGPAALPCEDCRNCRSVASGSSMDVLEIDGASNNSVEDVRDLREQVAYAPMEGRYRIYIIDEVHMLSKPAFNALLKTLEEPPAHVVFIFATTEINKVPQTILSRVQRFDFKRISEAHIRARLAFICGKEGIEADPAALEVLARKADGSMRDALSLFDQVHAFGGSRLDEAAVREVLGIPSESLFEDLLLAAAAHEVKGCFAVLDEAYAKGVEMGEFLGGYGEYLRDVLFARQNGMTAQALGSGEERFARLRTIAPDLKDGDLLRYAKIVSDLLQGLKAAAHPRLHVEMGLARMARLDRTVSLSQLLKGEWAAAGPSVPEPGPRAVGAGLEPALAPAPAAPGKAPPATETPVAKGAGSAPASPPPSAPAEAPSTMPEALRAVPEAPPTMPEAPRAVPEALRAASEAPSPVPETVPAPPKTGSAAPQAESATVDGPAAKTDESAAKKKSAEINGAGPAEAEAEAASDEDDADPEEEAGFPAEGLPPSCAEPDEDEEPLPRAEALEPAMAPVESLEELAAAWNQIVTEFMVQRPLLGSCLQDARLEVEPGDARLEIEPGGSAEEGGPAPGTEIGGTRILTVRFFRTSAHALAVEAADFRKSLSQFLASKLKGAEPFRLELALSAESPAPEEAEKPDRAGSGKPADLEEILRREPIVAYIRDLFQGRFLS